MLVSIEIEGRRFEFDASTPLNISIPLNFGGPQVNAYGVPGATSRACEAGTLVGDTRRGGSCNFEEYRLIPHCNGTHTESVGHLTHERISVNDCLRDSLIPCLLISVEPAPAAECADTFAATAADSDPIISRRALEAALSGFSRAGVEALAVRTLPNDDSKLTRTYAERIPPYFSNEAMELIAERGTRHLLADIPSIDRIFDEGHLSNHRKFWEMPSGSFESPQGEARQRTVTELIYVPSEIPDGLYLLNLQIAPFTADAAPSRPVLFSLMKGD